MTLTGLIPAMPIAPAAQQPPTLPAPPAPTARQQCTLPPPPFALKEANRLRRAALSRRIGGKAMLYTRYETGPNFNGEVRFRIDLRVDGSLAMRCDQKSEEARDWSPCRGFNRTDPKAKDRDVGVWRVDGGDLVIQRTVFEAQGFEEGRVALHEQDGALAVRRVRGPHFCLPGPIAVE